MINETTKQAACVNCQHTGDHDDNGGFCKVCGKSATKIKADNGREYEVISRTTADQMEANGKPNVARTMRENFIVADLHVRNTRSKREHLVYERLVKVARVAGPTVRELRFQYVVAL